MKFAKLSLAAIIALGVSASAADSLETMFKDGKVSGEIRSMYIAQDSDTATDSDGFAVGGKLKFETAKYMGLSFGAAFYTTHGVNANNVNELTGAAGFAGTHSNLLDENGNSYSLLGEAYAEYNNGNTMLKIGRQVLDTPFAGPDDIRIVPDLYEAYLLTNTDLADTTLVLAHVTKMAGTIDSLAPTASQFNSMSNAAGIAGAEDGVTVAAAIYSGFADTTLQAWYYTLSGEVDAWYLEASHNWDCMLIDGMKMNGALQYIDFSADTTANALDPYFAVSGVDYNVWGAKVEGAHTSGFGFDVAYNSTSDDLGAGAFSGVWGGYPEFAVADEFWHNDLNTRNSDVWRVGASYDFAKSGVNGLTADVAYVAYDLDNSIAGLSDIDVVDLILSYDVQSVANLSTSLVYEDRSSDANNADSDILKLYVGYTF